VAGPFLQSLHEGIERHETIAAAIAARLIKEHERQPAGAPGNNGGVSGWRTLGRGQRQWAGVGTGVF